MKKKCILGAGDSSVGKVLAYHACSCDLSIVPKSEAGSYQIHWLIHEFEASLRSEGPSLKKGCEMTQQAKALASKPISGVKFASRAHRVGGKPNSDKLSFGPHKSTKIQTYI